MGKLKKFLDSKLYVPVVFIVSFVFWLIAYLSKYRWIDESIYSEIENISLISFGVIAAILLILFKNTYYFIPWVIFIPFVFARPFDALTIPTCIFIGLGIMALGLVLNIIIYRPKIRYGKFFWGLLILCIAFVLGGINVKNENFIFQFFLTTLCVVAFLCLYCLIASSSTVKMTEIARLFTYLGIYLSLQVIMYFLLREDSIIILFLIKGVDVGWGVNNNVALMLLFTFPFTLYLAIINKRFKMTIYTLITLFQIVAIVLTCSRGAIAALVIGIILLIPYCILKAKDRILFICIIVSIILAAIIAIYIFSINQPEDFQKIIDLVGKINLETFNGRTPIYQECIDVLKENPIFGEGILAGFQPNEEGNVVYEWGHSTILQTIRSMGIVGCVAMFFHLGQKYYVLLNKPSIWKIMVVASFAISGLYGLFDVSYYFINYMIPLILGMAMLEFEFHNDEEDNYEVV